MFGTYKPEDVTLLLKDITGLVEPLDTRERERRIQGGEHYSRMLPIEYEPTPAYFAAYEDALARYAPMTARAVASVAEQICRTRESGGAVSLARRARPSASSSSMRSPGATASGWPTTPSPSSGALASTATPWTISSPATVPRTSSSWTGGPARGPSGTSWCWPWRTIRGSARGLRCCPTRPHRGKMRHPRRFPHRQLLPQRHRVRPAQPHLLPGGHHRPPRFPRGGLL